MELKSQKITWNIARRIKDAVIKHRFADDRDALVERERVFADAVYRDVYKAHLKKMEALPEGWLQSQGHFHVAFGGQYERIKFGDVRRVLARDVHNAAKVYDATHKLTVEFRAIKDADKSLRDSVREAESKVESAINSFNTTKQLIEGWPEVEKFVRQIVGQPKVNLPTVETKALNKLLDLPPEDIAA